MKYGASDLEKAIASLCGRLHRGEEGMVSWAFLVAVIFFLLFAGLVYNTGVTVNRKIEAQNAADAAAYSGSLWVARGMNAVTASNHLIGELTALYAIHHALGGEHLDADGEENDQPEIETYNEVLEFEYDVLKNLPMPISAAAPGPVKDSPKSDLNSTVYQSMLRLKQIMAAAYLAHGVSYVIYQAGQALVGGVFTAPLGAAMIAIGVAGMAAALLTELKAIQEYYVLKVVERMAKSVSPSKKQIPDFIKVRWPQRSVQ